MIRNMLSAKLGELRMSQAELARITNIRPNTINELYNDWAERISFDHLDSICKALGCGIGDLIVYVPDEGLADDGESKRVLPKRRKTARRER